MAFEKRAVERQQKGEAALEEVRTSIQAARDKVCDPLQLYWWQHCTQKAVLVAALHPENSRAELSACVQGTQEYKDWVNEPEQDLGLNGSLALAREKAEHLGRDVFRVSMDVNNDGANTAHTQHICCFDAW